MPWFGLMLLFFSEVSSDALLVRANASFKAQRLTEARALAEQVLQADHANPTALEIKGNVQYLLGDSKAAMATFIDLLESHPENRDASYMLGRIYYQEGLIDQAIGQFQRLLKLDARSYKAYDNLGLCYAAEGDNSRAIANLLTAIRLTESDYPHYDTAYADLAELLLKMGDPERAYDAAAKAAERNPDSARNFYLGGKALEQLGKTQLCINWLQRATALDPTYPEPEYLLAKVFRQRGDIAQADAAQKRFVDLKARTAGSRK